MKAETKAALDRWVEHGIYPGDFLSAVLRNALFQTWHHADSENWRDLVDILSYVYNNLPSGCWGSSETMRDWHHVGGVKGRKYATSTGF